MKSIQSIAVLLFGFGFCSQLFSATITAGDPDLDIGGDHSDLDTQGLYFATTDGSREEQWSQDDDLLRGAVDETPAWATPIDSGVGTSSGGWGYESVISPSGEEFEGGGGVTSGADIETEDELISFDLGVDVPSSFNVGIYTDQADRAGAPFTPAAYRLEIGDNSAEVFTESFDLIGDIYWFSITDASPGDLLVVYETDSGTAQAGNAGVTGGILFESADVGLLCDVNGDGSCDVADIDSLTTEVQNGTNNPGFDLNGDSMVDQTDRVVMVEELLNTYFGDSNLDGEFSSSDFVTVFSVGEYEDTTAGNSTWADGDWNGDGDFNSSDFVVAFSSGGYEKGPRVAAAVPEPSVSLLLFGLLPAFLVRRGRNS